MTNLGGAHLRATMPPIDVRQAGRRGALATNKSCREGWVKLFLEQAQAHADWIFYFGPGLIWLLHFFRQSARITALTFSIIGLVVVIFVVLVRTREAMSVSALTSLLLLYGVSLFVILGDILMGGLAKYLIAKRGEKWTKELDYVYLSIGSLGIVGTLNKRDFVSGRSDWADVIAPLILTTAVVIRVTKTRAEIEGWNKS
jgi:hypothetical protein